MPIFHIIIFKNSIELQDTFRSIDNDKILIETDSPLAPIPMREKMSFFHQIHFRKTF